MKTLTKLTDEQLVSKYIKGDNSAFGVLLSRHQSKVYFYILKITQDRELAEDLFQDTFIKAITSIQQGKYIENGKFLGWIYRIAHNLIIDHFRKEKNINEISADNYDYDFISNNTQLAGLSVEDIISNEQVLLDVVKLIEFLPPSQQEVVRMRYFEELSFKEIAEKTDVSINTALGRMRYALANMRKIAKDYNVYLEIK